MYSFCAMNSFRMSFWIVPDKLRPRHALALGDDQVHRKDHRRRRVDGHRGRHPIERDAVEQRLHVGQRHDRDAALAHFAEREFVIGIAPHQRGQIERDAEPRAAGRQQVAIALVGLFRRAEPGKLPHRPQLAAVARGMDAACVREDAGIGVGRVGASGHRARPPDTAGRWAARKSCGRPRRAHAAAGRIAVAPEVICAQYMSDAHTS